MARERGFIVEVTAFLPAGTTDVQDMAAAALRLEQLADWLHGGGFTAVAVSSKFTSRKVEAVAPFDPERHAADILNNGFNPMPDLDDSKFATNSGTPKSVPLAADENIQRLGAAVLNGDPLDIPAALDRRAKG